MNQIEDIYKTSPYPKEEKREEDPHTVKSGYGEISREGVEVLIEKFKERFNDPCGVFYDIGSGYGKMVMHVASVCKLKKCIGIEYVSQRNNIAKERSKKYSYATKELPEFIEGDACTMRFDDATIIYVDCTHFAQMFIRGILRKIPKGCLIVHRGYFGRKFKINDPIVVPTVYIDNYKAGWFIKE
tara:strand:- start:2843 stop:3397 length:555 start_codon:yes stop_codon:yes gene_type:complete